MELDTPNLSPLLSDTELDQVLSGLGPRLPILPPPLLHQWLIN